MNRGRSGVRPVGPSWPDGAHGAPAAPPPIGFRARMRLRQVLAEATFPAERWQLLAWADHYGADSLTRQELHGLPVGRYETIEQVIKTVERRGAGVGVRPTGGANRQVPRPFGGPAVA